MSAKSMGAGGGAVGNQGQEVSQRLFGAALHCCNMSGSTPALHSLVNKTYRARKNYSQTVLLKVSPARFQRVAVCRVSLAYRRVLKYYLGASGKVHSQRVNWIYFEFRKLEKVSNEINPLVPIHRPS